MTSRIESADDRLSRAASEVSRCMIAADEGAAADRGMDAGEWSAAAWDRRLAEEVTAILARYGYAPEEYETELERRTTPSWAYHRGPSIGGLLLPDFDFGEEVG